MMGFLGVAGLVVAFVLAIVVGGLLIKSRCPSCRKFFAGRVVHSSQIASVKTTEWGYDQERGTHRNMSMRHTGYLITRECRFCRHGWDRIESESAQIDKLKDRSPVD